MDAKQAVEQLAAEQPGALCLFQHLAGELSPRERADMEDQLVHLVLQKLVVPAHLAVKEFAAKLGGVA